MSLNTLLEAARYLEIQEQRQKQQLQELQKATTTTLDIIATPVVTSCSPPLPIVTRPLSSPRQSLIATTSSSTITTINICNNQDTSNLNQQIANPPRIIHNSFDIINPLVIDEGGEPKRKQPPLVFRAGTREVHNKLEKNRRAHLKECFDLLKRQLPAQTEEKKTSNLSILHSALRYIQILKRKERDLEHEMEKLAREKISAQQRLAYLKKEMSSSSSSQQCDVDLSCCSFLTDNNGEQLQVPIPSLNIDNIEVATASGTAAAVAVPVVPPQSATITLFNTNNNNNNTTLTTATTTTTTTLVQNSSGMDKIVTSDNNMVHHHLDTIIINGSRNNDDRSNNNNNNNNNDNNKNNNINNNTNKIFKGKVMSPFCHLTDDRGQYIISSQKTLIGPNGLTTAVMGPISAMDEQHHHHHQQQQCSSDGQQQVIRPQQMQPQHHHHHHNPQQQQHHQQQQTTALSVLPVAGYPPGLVLHKVALVPKGIADLTPLAAAVSSPVAHFITTSQQLNGKVLPLVNAQYVVKPVVVVSSPPSVTPRSTS